MAALGSRGLHTPTALASQIFFRARVARVRVYGSMCFDIALRSDIA